MSNINSIPSDLANRDYGAVGTALGIPVDETDVQVSNQWATLAKAAIKVKNGTVLDCILEHFVVQLQKKPPFKIFDELLYLAIKALPNQANGSNALLNTLLVEKYALGFGLVPDGQFTIKFEGATTLHFAAKYGMLKIFTSLHEMVGDEAFKKLMQVKDKKQSTVLHYAADQDGTGLVEVMMRLVPNLATERDSDGRTVAHIAVQSMPILRESLHDGSASPAVPLSIRSIVASCPDTLAIVDNEGASPYSLACSILEDFEKGDDATQITGPLTQKKIEQYKNLQTYLIDSIVRSELSMKKRRKALCSSGQPKVSFV
jgi:hypothetical protein